VTRELFLNFIHPKLHCDLIVPDYSITVVWSEWVNEKKSINQSINEISIAPPTKSGQRRDLRQNYQNCQNDHQETAATIVDLKLKVNEVQGAFSNHVYNIRHQIRAYRNLKNNLKQHEVVIHVDFSENYSCRYFSEVQACHFGASNCQATLRTGVLYTADGHVSFATISIRRDTMLQQYGPIYVQCSSSFVKLTHLLQCCISFPTDRQHNIKTKTTSTSCQQKPMHLDLKLWHRSSLKAGMGKVPQMPLVEHWKERPIACLMQGMISRMQKSCTMSLCKDSCVQITYVSREQIEAMDLLLPANLKPIPRTMKLHQLHAEYYGSLSYRILSCFCTRPTPCSWYNAAERVFLRIHRQHPEPSLSSAAADVSTAETTESPDMAPAITLPLSMFYSRHRAPSKKSSSNTCITECHCYFYTSDSFLCMPKFFTRIIFVVVVTLLSVYCFTIVCTSAEFAHDCIF